MFISITTLLTIAVFAITAGILFTKFQTDKARLEGFNHGLVSRINFKDGRFYIDVVLDGELTEVEIKLKGGRYHD